jgi:3-deoxy-D-manno-octulosonate 8-phosphate phosphatase KdsC-like HAD superfamily phosphatase
VTVPHAPAPVRAHAHYVTMRDGGAGAVRELADIILAAQGRGAESEARAMRSPAPDRLVPHER